MKKELLITIILAVIILLGIIAWDANTQRQQFAKKEAALKAASATTNEASPSGELKIEDIKVGEGTEVKVGDNIKIHYIGALTDGTVFENSYDSGQPFQTNIGVGEVIPGWDKGVIGMKIGGKRKLTIPPDMAYGANGSPPKIPANATLVFTVELMDLTPAASQ